MTELQTSLMAIGGAIVVGVITYNKWQEYKARKTVERAFSSTHDDVLMNPGTSSSGSQNDRQEPNLEHGVDDLVQDDFAGVAADSKTQIGEPTAVRRPSPQIELPVDAMIDCAIPLALAGVMRGDKIITPVQSLRHVGNKPVHFIGQRDDGAWEAIAHGGTYASLMAGVQLANRSNALNELEYSELVTRLRQVADDLDAEPDVPDMAVVMQSARALHQFVAEYDAQLSVNVHSNGAPWAINTLLAALERQGFDLRPDGRLVMPDGDGGILFTLSTNVTLAAETTARLTLLLDVPRVAPRRDGLGAMMACAKSLAKRLDGTVVDDSNQALSDEAMGEIAGQVKAFYGDMEAAEIPAGSTRAMRLFS
jgi:hypothetical protein